jgi:flagellar motor switch protein FliG
MESNENISTRVITQAQQSILSAMRKLEQQGMIVINKPTARET